MGNAISIGEPWMRFAFIGFVVLITSRVIASLIATRKGELLMKRRDVEKNYTQAAFVAKLRRLADALEQGKRFTIQVAGERITVPHDAILGVEHEREKGVEQIELQIIWNTAR